MATSLWLLIDFVSAAANGYSHDSPCTLLMKKSWYSHVIILQKKSSEKDAQLSDSIDPEQMEELCELLNKK